MTPEEEAEEQRLLKKKSEFLAWLDETIAEHPTTPNHEQIERDRVAGRETREQRRATLRQIRLDKWDSMIPPRFRGIKISDIDRDALRARITEWLAEPTRNVLFMSETPGVGKTFAAFAMARELFAEGLDVEVQQLSDLYDKLTPGKSDSYPRLLERVKSVEYLLLDDLGSDRSSEFRSEILYQIINHRWEWKLPTMVTTNLSSDELREMFDQRTLSRLTSEAMVVRFKGEDRRG